MFGFPIELFIMVGFIGGSLLIAYGVVFLNKRGYDRLAVRLGFFVPPVMVMFLAFFKFTFEASNALSPNDVEGLKVVYDSMRDFVILLLAAISGVSFGKWLELTKPA